MNIYACTYICAHTDLYVYICLYICTPPCVFTYIYIYIYKYICIHTLIFLTRCAKHNTTYSKTCRTSSQMNSYLSIHKHTHTQMNTHGFGTCDDCRVENASHQCPMPCHFFELLYFLGKPTQQKTRLNTDETIIIVLTCTSYMNESCVTI